MMDRQRLLLGTCAFAAGVALASGVAAQAVRSSATGAARLEVIRPLRLSTVATLAFGRASPTGAQGGSVTVAPVQPAVRTAQSATLLTGDAPSPFVASVTGEPRRSYRVSLPATVPSAPGGYPVGSFTIASRVAGTITTTRQAQLDAAGADTLTIGATLALPKGTKPQAYTAQVPVTISYE